MPPVSYSGCGTDCQLREGVGYLYLVRLCVVRPRWWREKQQLGASLRSPGGRLRYKAQRRGSDTHFHGCSQARDNQSGKFKSLSGGVG